MRTIQAVQIGNDILTVEQAENDKAVEIYGSVRDFYASYVNKSKEYMNETSDEKKKALREDIDFLKEALMVLHMTAGTAATVIPNKKKH